MLSNLVSRLSSLLSLEIIMSSANIRVYRDFCPTSSVNLSITVANKKELRSPNVITFPLWTHLSLLAYTCPYTCHTPVSPNFLIEHNDFSPGTLALDPQRHKATVSVLLHQHLIFQSKNYIYGAFSKHESTPLLTDHQRRTDHLVQGFHVG